MPLMLILALLLSLPGCKEESQDSNNRAAEIEAARRERVAIRESEDRRRRLQTLRVLGFAVLAGGAAILLVRAERPESLAGRERAGEPGLRSRSPRPRHPRCPDLRIIEVPDSRTPEKPAAHETSPDR